MVSWAVLQGNLTMGTGFWRSMFYPSQYGNWSLITGKAPARRGKRGRNTNADNW